MAYTWTSLITMPTKRVFSTPVEVNGELYVLGGCDVRGTPLENLEKYNPVENVWTSLDSMKTKRAGTCAVALGDQIVALGGISTSQKPLDAVEIFDTEKKTWSIGDGLKEQLLGLAGVARDNKVVVVGGMGLDTNPKDYLMDYDLARNKWRSLPPMPTPRYAAYAFLVGHKLYVLGGRQGKIPVRSFEVFDFQENKWTKLPDIPTNRVFAVYVHCDGYIYSLGGLNEDPQQGFTDFTEIFNIETGEWSTGAPMLTKRGDFAAGSLNGQIIVAGGLGNQGVPLRAAEVYDRTSNTWTRLTDMPASHCSCAYITFQDRLHIIGGLSVGGPTGSMEALGVKTR